LLGITVLLAVAAPRGATIWMPICTWDGPKWIKIDQDGRPAPEKPSEKPPPDRPCPFCLAGIGSVPFMLPSAPWLRLPVMIAAGSAQSWSQDAPGLCLAARPPPSRAPPFPSL
jgi:hypothetical protein